ncbi:uncharacterized protein BJ171DRAFT_398591, partial [Polychytrium aggregatum]|uniref:uncharacterized protein n=1 Tax=Polychytrium aggregatum TaxID=110093 RepID=UPI0022FE634E
SQTFFLTTHNHSLKLAAHPKRGRGVYATKTIPANTLVDISPILFFTPEEYQAHGRHTILDHYTYKWQNGSMALALGLGSLFNHSSRCQNVGFIRDFEHSCIKYYTLRDIQPEQELFISYGDHLWFD